MTALHRFLAQVRFTGNSVSLLCWSLPPSSWRRLSITQLASKAEAKTHCFDITVGAAPQWMGRSVEAFSLPAFNAGNKTLACFGATACHRQQTPTFRAVSDPTGWTLDNTARCMLGHKTPKKHPKEALPNGSMHALRSATMSNETAGITVDSFPSNDHTWVQLPKEGFIGNALTRVRLHRSLGGEVGAEAR